MPITLNDLTVNFSHLDRSALLEDWQWLIGGESLPVAVTAMGNAFLQNQADGSVWLLDAGTGGFVKVAESGPEFQSLLGDRDFVYERFLVEDFVATQEAGKQLGPGQVFGFATPPVLGGKYELENYVPTDMEVHFSVSGQIHRQVKDLPDGTSISGLSLGSA